MFGPAPLAPAIAQTLLQDFGRFFNGPRVFAAAASLLGETPLANVPVNAYDLAQFLANPSIVAVLAHTSTNLDGTYELALTDISAGTDLLVMVGTSPRLSTIVPDAGRDVNSVTTLAAEAWAQMRILNWPMP